MRAPQEHGTHRDERAVRGKRSRRRQEKEDPFMLLGLVSPFLLSFMSTSMLVKVFIPLASLL